MKINLENVPETLLIPLWGRAKLTKEGNSILVDSEAINIIERIQYDFSKIDKYFPYFLHIMNLVRAKMLENSIIEYLTNHPKATIINLGAGLDTTFSRVDNGLLRWYDIDFPDVIEIRKKLIPETERSIYIEDSIFEMKWIRYINKNRDGLLFIAGGVLEYYNESVVKKFFKELADNFKESEIVFNTARKNVISTFFINRTMKRLGMKAFPANWGINNIRRIKRWDNRIVLLEQYPLFSKIKMENSWNKKTIRTINFYNKWKAINIVHLKFLK
jgi:O-methyltransferase involved in polyketide biosynthesis